MRHRRAVEDTFENERQFIDQHEGVAVPIQDGIVRERPAQPAEVVTIAGWNREVCVRTIVAWCHEIAGGYFIERGSTGLL